MSVSVQCVGKGWILRHCRVQFVKRDTLLEIERECQLRWGERWSVPDGCSSGGYVSHLYPEQCTDSTCIVRTVYFVSCMHVHIGRANRRGVQV